MRSRRKRLFCVVVVGVVGLICVLVWILSHRDPVRPKTERVSEEAHTSTPKLLDHRDSVGSASPGKVRAEARRCFGVLVWPGMGARALNYSRTILSWMEEWGFECGFVTAQRSGGNEASSPLPADVTDGAWDLAEVSKNLNSIVLADGDLPPAGVAGVKQYLLSGGWAILPTPEGGRVSAEVEELIQLKPSRSATLMAPESPQSVSPLGAEEVRLLVSHSLAPGLAEDQWLEWAGPPGKVLYARRDEALPLLCFRRPELPAVRLVPFGDGGVVHWNFPLRPGPLIEDAELKTFLGDTLAWLFARANWVKPVQKEGALKGIVRRKEGQAIPGAKVSAQVYSEWGQPVQSFEVPSSAGGEFTLPVLEHAIYWVKAEAEGYYQVEGYLLARSKGEEGEQIEVLMEPEGSIFGHAYYGPGEDHPAAGIPVTLAPNCRISSAWRRETVADKDGRFSFGDLPSAQTFYLIAEAEGWMGLQEAPVPLEGGSLEIDVHLQSPISVEGRAVNVVTRQPLPGVEIVARPRFSSSGTRFLFRDALTRTAESGEDGTFTLVLLPGVWEYYGRSRGFTAVDPPGSLSISESARRMLCRLCPNAALHGRVFRSSGEFASGAKVTVSGIEYYADEKGEYRTGPVPPGISARRPYFVVKAEWNGESGSRRVSFKIASMDVKSGAAPKGNFYDTLLAGGFPVDVHLKPSEPEPEPSGTTVAGVVLDESGRPASSAVVELAEPSVETGDSTGLTVFPQKKTRSDSEGKFQFTEVKEGLWLVRGQNRVVQIAGNDSLYWGEEWLTVSKDMPVSDLQVRLGKAHVRGKVVRADGTPLRDRYASFQLTSPTGWSQGLKLYLGGDGGFDLCPSRGYNGRFAVLTLPPLTSYKQWADARVKRQDPKAKAVIPWEGKDRPPERHVRLAPQIGPLRLDPLDVRLGEESLTIRFPAMGAVGGRVLDADTKAPISGVTLVVEHEDRGFVLKKTDSEGAFSFDALPGGSYALTTSRPGYWPRHRRIEVVEGSDSYIDVELRTYYIIRGRLRLRETGELLVAEIRTKDGNYMSKPNGTFAIIVPWEGNARFAAYQFSVPLEGKGLKSVVEYVPRRWGEDIDVGDIYVEPEKKRDGEPPSVD